MGRKIPAKKHRSVKDPEKQRAKRLMELESRTNAPPKDANEQAIPKSLERVIQLKEATKNNSNFLKRKRKKNALICVGQQCSKLSLHPKARAEKIIPVFQQQPGESGGHFFHRVCKDTHAFLKETAFEKKYGVQIERDPETGQIQGLTKRKHEKDEMIEMLQAKHRNIKRKKTTKDSVTLTKNEKRKLKLRMKKEKKLENSDESGRWQDKITFGEVVHEPPRLKIKSKINEERRPKNLLLHSLLQDRQKTSSASRVIDRSGKRKNLPVAERRRLEQQQNEAIAVYRQLKSQRLTNRSC